MAFVHGKGSVFKLADGSDVLTDISAYIVKVSFKPSAGTNETTTLGKNSKTFIAGLKDGTIQLEFKWDSALDVILWNARGAIKTWEYHPEGTATGKVKYSGSAILQDFPFDSSVSDAVGGSVSLQITGDITRGTNP